MYIYIAVVRVCLRVAVYFAYHGITYNSTMLRYGNYYGATAVNIQLVVKCDTSYSVLYRD